MLHIIEYHQDSKMGYFFAEYSNVIPITRQLDLITRFDVEATQCIAAQLLLALQHLHGFNIYYR